MPKNDITYKAATRPRNSSGTMLCNTVLVEAAVSIMLKDEINNMGSASHKLSEKEKATKASPAAPALQPVTLNRPRILVLEAK